MNSLSLRSSIFLFFVFLFLTHLLASLSILPLMDRQGIWMGGILLSFGWLNRQGKRPEETPLLHASPKSDAFSTRAWILILLLGIFLRSIRLWDFPPWPLFDEASILQFALKLSQHWDWRFFYTDGQIPPILIWITALLLKITHHPLFSLLWVPFLFSCATLVAVGWTTRRFFTDDLAFLSTAFFALAYWPLSLMNLSMQAICLPLWEIGVFFLLAETIKKGWSPSENLRILFLGLWLGLGYWTYTSWPVVTLAALVIALWSARKKPSFHRVAFLLGTGLFLTGFSFFLLARQSGGYGTHLIGFSAFHGWIPEKQVWLGALDYIHFIFWGQWSPGIYVSSQGGFLNPWTGALFWVGVWEIFAGNTFSRSWRWLIPGLLFFLLPGMLSQNLQSYRVIQIMLLVLGLCALGAGRLCSFLPLRRRHLFLYLLLLVSLSWDIPRLLKTWTDWNRPNAQIRMVYQTLQKIAQVQGPGLCFTQFKVQRHPEQGLTLHPEENLEAAVFPFNAAQNPNLKTHPVRWAALLVCSDEVSFLRKSFPTAQWLRAPLLPCGDPLLDLGLIPITAKQTPRLEKWVQASQWLETADWKSLNVANPSSYQQALKYWLTPPPVFKTDRFLQTCYWERLSEFYYYHGYEKHYLLQMNALKNAITQGDPAPHLYYDLGCLLLRKNKLEAAQKNLEKALRGDPSNPDIQYAMNVLKKLRKKTRLHP